jgi:hypothetical protein
MVSAATKAPDKAESVQNGIMIERGAVFMGRLHVTV